MSIPITTILVNVAAQSPLLAFIDLLLETECA